MLSREGCLRRRERLWSQVPATAEWLLVADPRHVYLLSGFLVNPISFSQYERGLLLLERSGEATLLADNFTRRSAIGAPHVDRELIEDWYTHQQGVVNRDHALLAALKACSPRLSGRHGLVEAEWLPAAALSLTGISAETAAVRGNGDGGDRAAAPDLGSLIRHVRRVKESDELEILHRCMRATEAGHARAREVLRPGISELELYTEIQAAATLAAGQPAVIYGDFRALNAETPKAGGLPTAYVLQQDDLFLLDYSVVIDGYRSDFTNTMSVSEPTDEQDMLFRLCQSAMEAGESVLKEGVPAADVYTAVSRPLNDAGYGPLSHHAGHGIGLGHPEPPILVPHSSDVLVAGDVVTLEPGLYVEGIGGMRIEHNYLVTSTGYERLSNHLISLS